MAPDPRPSRLRWILPAIWLLVVVAAAVVYLALSALSARSHLERARAGLATVRSDITNGDVDGALRELDQVTAEAKDAHDRVQGPVWWLGAHVPYFGRPLATVRTIVGAAYDVTAHALPPLARQADHLRPSRLRPQPDTIDLSQLTAAAPALEAAAADLARDEQRVAASKPSWLSTVANARRSLLTQLETLAGTTRAGAITARAAPPMLGADGPRRYFVGFQNTAESRGTGGLIGGYAIVSANQGHLHVDRVASDADFPPVRHPATGLDPAFVRRYGVFGADQLWVNTNLSPNFPDAAAVWASLWQQATGQRIDGAIALDPAALADIITATGPVDVPGIGSVSADRVVPLIGQEEYQLFPDQAQRKKVLVGVAHATIEALLAGHGDTQTVIRQLGAAIGGGHLLLESMTPSVEADLVAGGVSGVLPQTKAPFAMASVFNAAGSKLDYYLDASTSYSVDSCSSASRSTTITVRLHNGAPAGLPSYVTTRGDNPSYPTQPGDNRLYVQVFTTDGSVLQSAMLDGRRVSLDKDTEQGHPVFSIDLEIKREATRTLVLRLTEPVGHGLPLMPVQDMARPWHTSVDVGGCG